MLYHPMKFNIAEHPKEHNTNENVGVYDRAYNSLVSFVHWYCVAPYATSRAATSAWNLMGETRPVVQQSPQSSILLIIAANGSLEVYG